MVLTGTIAGLSVAQFPVLSAIFATFGGAYRRSGNGRQNLSPAAIGRAGEFLSQESTGDWRRFAGSKVAGLLLKRPMEIARETLRNFTPGMTFNQGHGDPSQNLHAR